MDIFKAIRPTPIRVDPDNDWLPGLHIPPLTLEMTPVRAQITFKFTMTTHQ